MIRRAFTMRLKPGTLSEYVRHHDSIHSHWASLVAQIEASGIARMVIFRAPGDAPQLFLYSEIIDEQAWTRLWGSAIHDAWGTVMEPLLHFKDGKVDASPLTEIFCLETAAVRLPTPTATQPPAPAATPAQATSAHQHAHQPQGGRP